MSTELFALGLVALIFFYMVRPSHLRYSSEEALAYRRGVAAGCGVLIGIFLLTRFGTGAWF